MLQVLIYSNWEMCSSVVSGSDDPDNPGQLGHCFGGSSGSHPQIKLSGCDLDN